MKDEEADKKINDFLTGKDLEISTPISASQIVGSSIKEGRGKFRKIFTLCFPLGMAACFLLIFMINLGQKSADSIIEEIPLSEVSVLDQKDSVILEDILLLDNEITSNTVLLEQETLDFLVMFDPDSFSK